MNFDNLEEAMPALKDSGKRETFETGSNRDSQEGKGRFDIVPTWVIWLIGRVYEDGAIKYALRNWEAGQPLGQYIKSAENHLAKHKMGMRDEPHMLQAIWNLLGYVFTATMIKIGKRPSELNNMWDQFEHAPAEPLSNYAYESLNTFFQGEYIIPCPDPKTVAESREAAKGGRVTTTEEIQVEEAAFGPRDAADNPLNDPRSFADQIADLPTVTIAAIAEQAGLRRRPPAECDLGSPFVFDAYSIYEPGSLTRDLIEKMASACCMDPQDVIEKMASACCMDPQDVGARVLKAMQVCHGEPTLDIFEDSVPIEGLPPEPALADLHTRSNADLDRYLLDNRERLGFMSIGQSYSPEPNAPRPRIDRVILSRAELLGWHHPNAIPVGKGPELHSEIAQREITHHLNNPPARAVYPGGRGPRSKEDVTQNQYKDGLLNQFKALFGFDPIRARREAEGLLKGWVKHQYCLRTPAPDILTNVKEATDYSEYEVEDMVYEVADRYDLARLKGCIDTRRGKEYISGGEFGFIDD